MGFCKQCNKWIVQPEGRKEKTFCNSTCRSNYWYKLNKKGKQTEGVKTSIEYSKPILDKYDSEKLSKIIQDEPPMFQSVPFNQEADFMARIKEAKNMEELKKIVQEVEKSGLTFFPKKRIKEYAEKIGQDFYQD